MNKLKVVHIFKYFQAVLTANILHDADYEIKKDDLVELDLLGVTGEVVRIIEVAYIKNTFGQRVTMAQIDASSLIDKVFVNVNFLVVEYVSKGLAYRNYLRLKKENTDVSMLNEYKHINEVRQIMFNNFIETQQSGPKPDRYYLDIDKIKHLKPIYKELSRSAYARDNAKYLREKAKVFDLSKSIIIKNK